MKRAGLFFCAVVCLLAVACGGSSGATPTASSSDGGANFAGLPVVTGAVRTTPSGLKYVDIRAGAGTPVAVGLEVSVHYTLWLTNGAVVVAPTAPLVFLVGARQAIPGLDEGVSTMKVGGKRRLVIPPELGFGNAGVKAGPFGIVPPQATLIVDVEVLSAKKP